MREIFEIIVERYFSRGKSKSKNQLEKVRVRNAIMLLCSQNLVGLEDVLVFEVLPKSLPYAVSILDDEVLNTEYTVRQIDETLFEARLVSLDFL